MTDLDIAAPTGDAPEVVQVEAARREPGHRLKQLLRADIVAGHIPAGSRLKVSDVIARYGTSTNPAREALHALEGEGLVVITPNRGARVRSIDDEFVNCIFDIRRLIEPYIVRWFTEYATAEDRRILEEIQIKVQAAADAEDLPEFHKHNRGFHDLILSRHFNTGAVQDHAHAECLAAPSDLRVSADLSPDEALQRRALGADRRDQGLRCRSRRRGHREARRALAGEPHGPHAEEAVRRVVGAC